MLIDHIEKIAVMGPKHYGRGARELVRLYRTLGVKGKNAEARLASLKKAIPLTGSPDDIIFEKVTPSLLRKLEKSMIETGFIQRHGESLRSAAPEAIKHGTRAIAPSLTKQFGGMMGSREIASDFTRLASRAAQIPEVSKLHPEIAEMVSEAKRFGLLSRRGMRDLLVEMNSRFR